eukprot:gene34580-biopygen33769
MHGSNSGWSCCTWIQWTGVAPGPDRAIGGFSALRISLRDPTTNPRPALWKGEKARSALQASAGALSGCVLHRTAELSRFRSAMAGCQLEYEAVFPAYNGADAGYRKFMGDECILAQEGNALGCWWVWRRGRFEGEGCVWAESLECLSSHLTDFSALQSVEVGDVAAGPGEMTVISGDDMTSVSMQDLQESSLLITIVGCLIMLGLFLWLVSNLQHRCPSKNANSHSPPQAQSMLGVELDFEIV